jgi:hypothetical protein
MEDPKFIATRIIAMVDAAADPVTWAALPKERTLTCGRPRL